MATSPAASAALARRYAKAVFELTIDTKSRDQVAHQLESLQQLASENAHFQQLLNSPRISRDQKESALLALMKPHKPHLLVQRLVSLLARNGRLTHLPAVATAYAAMVKAQLNTLEATVTSATPLSKAQVTELKKALETNTGKTIHLHTSEDPALLGGMVIRLGSMMIDHSLSHHLERLKNTLKQAAAAA